MNELTWEEGINMKYKRKIAMLFTLLILFTVGCSKNDIILRESHYDNDNNKEDNENFKNTNDIQVGYIKSKIMGMSLQDKIGQLIIVGFEGKEINDEIIKDIEELKVGGFILFARNIEDENQLLTLLNDIKEANSNEDIPLFLAIDEEGGKVSRLPKSYVKLPDAMKVGEKNDKEISYKFGEILGKRVMSLGFNLNFAPILDINSNPSNPVIGRRAFGTTVNQVVNNGLKVIEGIRNTGVIPAVKHFPGHGDTDIDSHVNLPIVNKTVAELKLFELIPFREAIEVNTEMIMIAHILYPKIDKYNPCTMSTEIVQGLLRDELGYKGIIISDDMTMGAIVNNYSLEEGVISFLKAGGDIALICHGNDNPKKIVDKISEAVKNGELCEEDIDKKVYRILELKEKYGLEDRITDKIELDILNNETRILIEEINK